MPKEIDTWGHIPQEKFDAMGKAIKKSTCKELKIKSIDISDYKNIEYINTELGDINIVGGHNGKGKSSFVESIFTAIQGNTYFGKGKIQPAQLIKKGENQATIRMIIAGKETEIFVERVFKKGTKAKPQGTTKLVAKKNGEEIKQAELNEILKVVSIDPIDFGNLSITEQIKEVKQTTGLETNEIDSEIQSKIEDRKESKRYFAERKTIYDELVSGGVPAKKEETSVSKLLEDRKKVSDFQKKAVEAKEKKAEIEKLNALLEEKKEELKTINKDGRILSEAQKGLGNINEIDEKIKNIETENKEAQKYTSFVKAKEELKKAQEDVEKDEELVETLRKKRIKLISESNLPKYMEISEDLGILVDGIEFKLLNTARKIDVVIDLVLISESPLRTIRIENGGELDIKTLKEISDKIEKAGFQGFFERPIVDKYDTIIISDGEILEGEEKENFISNQ